MTLLRRRLGVLALWVLQFQAMKVYVSLKPLRDQGGSSQRYRLWFRLWFRSSVCEIIKQMPKEVCEWCHQTCLMVGNLM